MDSYQRLRIAACQELAIRLTDPPRPEARPWAAESAPVPVLPTFDLEADQEILRGLARAVVGAVLELSGRDLDPSGMAQTVQSAARGHLGARLAGKERLMARLAAEIPRLLDLPRLASLAREGISLAPLAAAGPEPDPVLGNNPEFTQALDSLARVAQTDFPVVIWGETGTGKELLARRVHGMSARRGGPFVPVNCAALSGNLLESELFGHVKGAFTGAATAKQGYISAAKGGTLFLDEIGETGREFQVKLLRVLEDRVVVPVGASSGSPVDFRLVCASHVDLEPMAEKGRFLSSLLYRINVVPVRLPPLRQRPEDIATLAEHFMAQACRITGQERKLSAETLACMRAYKWPGNVRELRHLMQRLVTLSKTEEIGPGQLPPNIRRPTQRSRRDAILASMQAQPDIPRNRVSELAAFLAGQCGQTISNADLRSALGCSESTAKNLFRTLRGMGLVEALGERGGRRYMVADHGPLNGPDEPQLMENA